MDIDVDELGEVATGLVVGVVGGTLMFIYAEQLTAFQRGAMKRMRYPDRIIRQLTPKLGRIMGALFIAWGVLVAVMGLFFAD